MDQGYPSRNLLGFTEISAGNYERVCSARQPNQKTSRSAIRTGKLVVNLDTRIVSVDDRVVHLSGKEYGVLELLSRHKGTVVTKEMFLAHLYGGIKEPELKIIDVFVCHLRKKLARETGGNHYIETVWGRGYVLPDPILTGGRPTAGRHEGMLT